MMLLVIILFVIGIFFFLNQSLSFNEYVLKDTNTTDITSIEVIHSPGEETIIIDDQNKIEEFISLFSEADLKRITFLNNSGDSNFEDVYWITIKVKEERVLLLRLDSELYLTVTGKEQNRVSDYKISQNFNLDSLEKIFE
jgi:hypothetical protein